MFIVYRNPRLWEALSAVSRSNCEYLTAANLARMGLGDKPVLNHDYTDWERVLELITRLQKYDLILEYEEQGACSFDSRYFSQEAIRDIQARISIKNF